MKTNSSENYLDQLLNSVNGEHTDGKDAVKQEPLSSEEQWERDLFGDPESDEEITAKNEEDFLREFEAELLKDDMLSPYSDLGNEHDKEVDHTIEDVIQHMSDQPKEENTEPPVDENAEFEGTLPDEETTENEQVDSTETEEKAHDAENMDDAVDAFDENLATIPDELQPPVDTAGENADEEGELDLSGAGDSDLMDMLSESDELSDLGDLLSSAQDDRPVEEGDSIGEFAQSEMDAQEQEMEEQESSDTSKKSKRDKKSKNTDGEPKEKQGLFARLAKLFFGEEEEEKKTLDDITDQTAGMSDENKKILEELEAAGELEDPKPKKEKKKKEKKKKEPKPKKPKKVKAPKPKKEKKPREKDHTPPLPKGPVIAIVVMVASLFGLIMLGTNLLGYQSNVNTAREEYGKGSYVEAFSKLQGLKIREKDSEFYDQLQVLAVVSEKYQDYLVFSNKGRQDIALDNLICAYGRYDLNKQKAQDANCDVEYEQLGGKIIKSLLEDYDMTGDEALQIYNAKNRKEYTLKLHAKLKSLGLE